MTTLPAPDSVDESNLRLPPASKQDTLKVLAVLSSPAHPLFNRCAHSACSNLKTSNTIRLSPAFPHAIATAIEALPDGLSPRQAAIAASFLASLLYLQAPNVMSLARTTNSLRSLFPRTPDPQTLCIKLSLHGIVCRDAAGCVAPQEIDSLPFDQAKTLKGAMEKHRDEELPQWACCPRYLTLMSLSNLSSALSEDEVKRVAGAVITANTSAGDTAARPELAAWLLRCLLHNPQDSCLLHVMLGSRMWPAGAETALQEALMQPSMEPVLLSLTSRWLEQLRASTPEGQDLLNSFYAVIVATVCHLLQAICLAYPACSPPPAYRFIMSVVSMMLDMMAGPACLLPPPATPRSPGIHAMAGSSSSSGTTSSSTTATATTTPSSHRMYEVQRQPQNVKPSLQLKYDQLQQHVERRQDMQDLLLDLLDYLAWHANKFPCGVVPEAVQSGLAAKMFVAVLLVGAEDGLEETTSHLMRGPMENLIRDFAAGAGYAVRHEMGQQIMDVLEAQPDLVCKVLDRLDHRPPLGDGLAYACAATLPETASSDAVRSLLMYVVLPILSQERAGQTDTKHKLAAACCLVKCRAAPELLWSGDGEEMEDVLEHMNVHLGNAVAMAVLAPATELIMALEFMQSPNCGLSRQEVLACQKELLWRIGQVLEQEVSMELIEKYWQHIAEAADQKMSGAQLEQLYRVLVRQGYCSQDPARLDEYLKGLELVAKAPFTTSSAVCIFLCQILAHAAMADPSSLPDNHTEALSGLVEYCLFSRLTLIAGQLPPEASVGRGAVLCAVASCLLTEQRMQGGMAPAAPAFLVGFVSSFVEWPLRPGQQPVQPPAVQAAAVALLAGMFRRRSLREASGILVLLGAWLVEQQLVEATGAEECCPAAEMLSSLNQGFMAVADEAGLVRAVRSACDACSDQPATVSNIQQLLGQPHGGILGLSAALQAWSSSILSFDEVDWEARLPEEWPGVDELMQLEWWGLLQEWLPLAADHVTALEDWAAGGVGAGEVEVRQAGPAADGGCGTGQRKQAGASGVAGGAGVFTKPPVPAMPADVQRGGLGSGPVSSDKEGPMQQARALISGHVSMSTEGSWVALREPVGGEGVAGERQCAACGLQSEPLQLCSGCQALRYCSVDCQKGHWKQHKRACKAAAAAALLTARQLVGYER